MSTMRAMAVPSCSVVLGSITIDAAIVVAYGVHGRASHTPMIPTNADAQSSLITASTGSICPQLAGQSPWHSVGSRSRRRATKRARSCRWRLEDAICRVGLGQNDGQRGSFLIRRRIPRFRQGTDSAPSFLPTTARSRQVEYGSPRCSTSLRD